MTQNLLQELPFWEIFIGHHHALEGLFYKNITLDDETLQVESNVEDDKNWEYTAYINPIEKINWKLQNMYTNQPIESTDYELVYTDVWMAHALDNTNLLHNVAGLEVVKVQDDLGIMLFAELFLAAYSVATDPYGKLNTSYQSTIVNAFQSQQTTISFYYVVYQGTPCATFALSFKRPYCYTYCIGVIPAYRGHGLSHFIHQYRNSEAAKNNCHYNILQTISTSFVEAIAKKNGFVPIEVFSFYQSKQE